MYCTCEEHSVECWCPYVGAGEEAITEGGDEGKVLKRKARSCPIKANNFVDESKEESAIC